MTERTLDLDGTSLPRIGLGTGRLRGDEAIVAIHAALDNGYRHIDTAAKYGNETDVGRALREHRLDRKEIFVTTKVMAPGLKGSEGNQDPTESLDRLQLDYVDLLLLHWPNQALPMAAQLDVLAEAQRRGQARHIGVCNFPKDWLVEARKQGYAIVANQAERHPFLDQTSVTQTCIELGIALIAFSPMGRGALLEDPTVLALAEKHGRTPAQIILRWHMEKPGNAVVPSSSSPERIRANIDVFDFALESGDLAALDRLARADARVVRGPEGYDWTGSPVA
jgi:diketogulonate reductase-like aldo/keto reductase